ncbi:MAG TPA: 50S ribosomal protein L25 [Gemmataceae bacterium]|nr:50S ribosomal protein L25 [Gemmataceae bacterium]
MAEAIVLTSQARQAQGTREARRLRRRGLLPAVLYGHKEETLSLTLPREEVERAIRHGVRVLDLNAGGKVEKALIREVQWDHLGKDLLHVDFARVSADERVEVTVPLEIRGTAAGIAQGGVLDQPIHTLNIECLAISLPESIRVNVGELQLGQAIHIRELVLPPGVKALGDPDAIVVQVRAKEVEPEVAAPVEVAEQAEPEVIGRQKPEAEEEEEK